jgi:TetR/AcrR family transcriptional regulator, regulator of cefoperazone and chloramphenicol sensitivity
MLVSDSPAILQTREKLIAAAGPVFAEHGFHKATVREITDRAGVNVAAINYHFRDKAELYAECLRAAQCTAMEAAGEWLCPSDSAHDRLRHFIDRMVRRLLNPNRPKWHHAIMSREMLEPSGALDQLVEQGIRPDCRELAAIITELTGGKVSQDRTFLLGCSVVAQCLFFLQNRPIIDRLYPQYATNPPAVEELVEHIYAFSLAAILAAQ